MPSTSHDSLLVIGGGVSGLACAITYKREHPSAQVTVLEKEERLGGLLNSKKEGEFCFELGPDSILEGTKECDQLIDSLSLEDKIVRVSSGARRALLQHQGKLIAIPKGFELLASGRPWQLLNSPVLSWRAKLRLLVEPLVPKYRGMRDESVKAFVTRRLGEEVYHTLAQPLAAGIYGVSGEELSLSSTLPRFKQFEARYGSVAWGLFKNSTASSGARYGKFRAFRNGMSDLASALEAEAHQLGIECKTGTTVEELIPNKDGSNTPSTVAVHLRYNSGDTEIVPTDRVVLAIPAYRIAPIIRRANPILADELEGIAYGSMATVTCAWSQPNWQVPRDASGYVVPESEGGSVLAATFVHAKYPGKAPDGAALLRFFMRVPLKDTSLLEASDQAIFQKAFDDGAKLLGFTQEPEFFHVERYHRAMPIYQPGHEERVRRVEELLLKDKRIHLAGNFLDGVGLPQSIRRGIEAARFD